MFRVEPFIIPVNNYHPSPSEDELFEQFSLSNVLKSGVYNKGLLVFEFHAPLHAVADDLVSV